MVNECETFQDPRTPYQRLVQDHLYDMSGNRTLVDPYTFLIEQGESEVLAQLGADLVRRADALGAG